MEANGRSTLNPREDVYLVQNPALGAAAVWSFVEGYNPGGRGCAPLLPMLFIVLPIIYHKELRDAVMRTRPSSGLRLFAGKFKDNQDVLYGIQSRMLGLRELSLSSISIALDCGLLAIDSTSAKVNSLRHELLQGLSVDIENILNSAGRLGGWCENLTLQEMQAVLRVQF